jgi:hypothetical protein
MLGFYAAHSQRHFLLCQFFYRAEGEHQVADAPLQLQSNQD